MERLPGPSIHRMPQGPQDPDRSGAVRHKGNFDRERSRPWRYYRSSSQWLVEDQWGELAQAEQKSTSAVAPTVSGEVARDSVPAVESSKVVGDGKSPAKRQSSEQKPASVSTESTMAGDVARDGTVDSGTGSQASGTEDRNFAARDSGIREAGDVAAVTTSNAALTKPMGTDSATNAKASSDIPTGSGRGAIATFASEPTVTVDSAALILVGAAATTLAVSTIAVFLVVRSRRRHACDFIAAAGDEVRPRAIGQRSMGQDRDRLRGALRPRKAPAQRCSTLMSVSKLP